MRRNHQGTDLEEEPHPLTDQLPNPENLDSQPKKPHASLDQLIVARVIVNLASHYGVRQMITALHQRMINHYCRRTMVKTQSGQLAKILRPRPKACSANSQNLKAGRALVLPTLRDTTPETNRPVTQLDIKRLVKSKPLTIIKQSQ